MNKNKIEQLNDLGVSAAIAAAIFGVLFGADHLIFSDGISDEVVAYSFPISLLAAFLGIQISKHR